MERIKRAIAGLLLAGCPLLLAQSSQRALITLERASVGKDGIVHVKWSGQPEQIIPPDRDGYREDKAHCAAVGANYLSISYLQATCSNSPPVVPHGR